MATATRMKARRRIPRFYSGYSNHRRWVGRSPSPDTSQRPQGSRGHTHAVQGVTGANPWLVVCTSLPTMRRFAIAFVLATVAAPAIAAELRPAGRTTIVSLLGDE